MESRKLYFVFTIIILMVAIIDGVEAQTTYIDSSNFEKVSALQKSPTGWTPTEIPKTKDYVDFIWDEETFYKDKMSISIKISKEHPEEEMIAYNWHTDIQDWENGHTYEYSCWVKGEDLKEAIWVCVQCWNEEMTKILKFTTTQHDYPLAGTFDWQQIGAVFTIPKERIKSCLGQELRLQVTMVDVYGTMKCTFVKLVSKASDLNLPSLEAGGLGRHTGCGTPTGASLAIAAEAHVKLKRSCGIV